MTTSIMRMFAQMTVIALVLLSVFCVSTTPVSAAITTWAPAPAPSRPSWTTKAYSPGPAPAASAPTSTHLPGSRRGHVAAPVPAPKPSGVSAAPGPAPPGYYAPAPAPVGPISAAAASASSLPWFTTAAISLISALVFIAAAASS